MSNLKFKAGVSEQEIFFSDTTSGTSLPVIVPCEGIELYINDERITGETTLNSDDRVTYEPIKETISSGNFEINISEDKLSAYLTINPSQKKTHILQDHELSEKLQLEAEVAMIAENDISKEEVLEELKRLNIAYGIMEDKLDEILEETTEEPLMVAQGEAPSNKCQIEYFFDHEFDFVNSKADTDGMVNIPFVEQGALIACILTNQEEKPGKDIMGNTISAESKEISIETGEYALFKEEKGEIRALIDGYPAIEYQGDRHIFDVLNRFSIEGDLECNVKFLGNVHIKNNVKKGSRIMNKGKTVVAKNVQEAQIESGGSLKVENNVLASTLEAGGCEGILNQMKPVTSSLKNKVATLIKNVNAFSSHPNNKNKVSKQEDIFKFINSFIKMKLPKAQEEVQKFNLLVNQLMENPMNFNLPYILMQTISTASIDLTFLFDSKSLQPVNYSVVLISLNYIDNCLRKYTDMEYDVTVHQCTESTIKAERDVYVTSQCLQSNIIAKRKIVVEGVARGGTLYAEGGIQAQEVTSTPEIETQLTVPPKQRIVIEKASENTILTIGKSNHRLKKDMTYIDAYAAKGKINLR